MKGDKGVIKRLNDLLAGELTAADQYFVQARMFHDWGLHRLYERIDHERTDELGHASDLVNRILFLEGVPDVAAREPLSIGADVVEMLKNDLEMERTVAGNLKMSIAYCEEARDYESRSMLEKLLKDTEEDHIFWLETQLDLIDRMGLENYVQLQAKPAD